MKTIIRVDSSHIIGSGHVMRCLNLAEMLSKEGHEVSFICRDLPGNLAEIIKEKSYSCLLLPFSEEQKQSCLAAPITDDYAIWLGVSQEQDAKETLKIIKDKQIDLLVIDHYGLDEKWEKKIRPYVKNIMIIDDLANRQHDCDILLDHNFYLNLEHRYDSLVPPHCKKLLGPGYALINPKLRSVKKTRIKAGKNKLEKIERVFVFMGGTDPRNFTEKVVEQLLYSPLKDCVIDVVLGKENTYKTELKQRFSENDNVVFHVQPNYYFELMEKADLAIGSNGVAQLERLYINLPSVVIPIAANQEPIYNDLIKAQAILPWDFLLEEDSKIELNQISITVFTIANIIQAKPLVLRKVTVEDAQDIYNWRIHSSVSSVSKSSSFFSYEDHLIWINQKLQQENCLFLICELENKSKLGVVRFDINDQDAFISIFLNPSYQRLGYGKKFLKKALDFFKKENHPCNRIIAEVLVANIASKKLFSNVGFKQEKNTYILKFRSNL